MRDYMSRIIYCHKLHQEAEGLDFPPFPGELGKKIYETISKQAWKLWLTRQTMFINEYRLDLLDAKAQTFLSSEMEKFLFANEENLPPGYTPQSN